MSEVIGIDSIKAEVSLAFAVVVPILAEIHKDNFQTSDLFAFVNSEDFKLHLNEVIRVFSKTGAEFKDFSLDEGFDLIGHIISEAKELVKIYKK